MLSRAAHKADQSPSQHSYVLGCHPRQIPLATICLLFYLSLGEQHTSTLREFREGQALMQAADRQEVCTFLKDVSLTSACLIHTCMLSSTGLSIWQMPTICSRECICRSVPFCASQEVSLLVYASSTSLSRCILPSPMGASAMRWETFSCLSQTPVYSPSSVHSGRSCRSYKTSTRWHCLAAKAYKSQHAYAAVRPASLGTMDRLSCASDEPFLAHDQPRSL